MDSDFPMLAGARLGMEPLDIREGLRNGSLDGLRLSSAIGSLWPRNPMAPENSEPWYSAMGSVQPEETFAAPMA